jgi:hypothetical protein
LITICKQSYGLIDRQGILYTEDAATAALERVEVCAAAEGFAEVTGECAYVCAFAAGHAH